MTLYEFKILTFEENQRSFRTRSILDNYIRKDIASIDMQKIRFL